MFYALYLLGNQRQGGFVAMAIANAVWMAVGVLCASWAMIIGNGILLVANVRGWWQWRHRQLAAGPQPTAAKAPDHPTAPGRLREQTA